MDGDQPVQTVPNAYAAASLRNRFLPIIEEIVDCLIKAGIAVRQFHGEGSPGLFEISLEHLPPVEAVDAVVYGQETVKTVCANHGLRGTVFPKPFEKLMTVGLHYHLSISRVEKQESFLVGLLGSWASLAAFCMPNYGQLHPGHAQTRRLLGLRESNGCNQEDPRRALGTTGTGRHVESSFNTGGDIGSRAQGRGGREAINRSRPAKIRV